MGRGEARRGFCFTLQYVHYSMCQGMHDFLSGVLPVTHYYVIVLRMNLASI